MSEAVDNLEEMDDITGQEIGSNTVDDDELENDLKELEELEALEKLNQLDSIPTIPSTVPPMQTQSSYASTASMNRAPPRRQKIAMTINTGGGVTMMKRKKPSALDRLNSLE